MNFWFTEIALKKNIKYNNHVKVIKNVRAYWIYLNKISNKNSFRYKSYNLEFLGQPRLDNIPTHKPMDSWRMKLKFQFKKWSKTTVRIPLLWKILTCNTIKIDVLFTLKRNSWYVEELTNCWYHISNMIVTSYHSFL